MLESLRGPKGSIVEGLIPLVMMASVLCWLVFVRYRRYRHRPLSSDAAWGGGALLLVIGMSIGIVYPIYLGSRSKARLINCMSNMKQLQSGMMQYASDYDERLPPSNRWASLIVLYTHEDRIASIWHCPNSSSPYSYAFNQSLDGLSTSVLDDTANTVCLFESDTALKNAVGGKDSLSQQERHNDRLMTSFLDGHVKFTFKQKLIADLRWQPLFLTPEKQP